MHLPMHSCWDRDKNTVFGTMPGYQLKATSFQCTKDPTLFLILQKPSSFDLQLHAKPLLHFLFFKQRFCGWHSCIAPHPLSQTLRLFRSKCMEHIVSVVLYDAEWPPWSFCQEGKMQFAQHWCCCDVSALQIASSSAPHNATFSWNQMSPPKTCLAKEIESPHGLSKLFLAWAVHFPCKTPKKVSQLGLVHLTFTIISNINFPLCFEILICKHLQGHCWNKLDLLQNE